MLYRVRYRDKRNVFIDREFVEARSEVRAEEVARRWCTANGAKFVAVTPAILGNDDGLDAAPAAQLTPRVGD